MFRPTALTIIGVILYLRQGWVVGSAGLLGGLADQRQALLRHWELAREHYGKEKLVVSNVRTHAIKYAQYHPDPVGAREQLVRVRSAAELAERVATVFDDRHDDGPRRELRRDEAVVPALNSCTE